MFVLALMSAMQVFGAASFKALPYTDPFAPAATPGDLTYSQPASSVVLNENLNGVALPITRQPASITSGFRGLTIEWWLKQKPGSGTITSNPDGTIMHGPGFAVNADWQWGGGPGSIIINFSQNKGGQYAGNRGAVIPLLYSDEQWHHYVVTYDTRTVRTYMDGELLEQKWLDNNTDLIGPYEDDSGSIATSVIEVGGGVTTGGRRFQNGYLEAARVSTVVLTPWQVKRNFENTRNYTKTLYVAPNASGTGSASSPMSLASAMAQIGGATRIILQGGTYNGSDFQVTRSGASVREHCVIVGADGSTPAIISGGSPAVSGAGHITLRNLTFSSDSGAALQVNNAPNPVTIDSCRLSGSGRGLSVNSSANVSVLNCVVNAGTGLYFNNSPDSKVRHNTIVNGSVGAQFDANSVRISMLNNLISGQSSACLVINSSQSKFRGNGNLYNPASGTAVSINGTTYSPAQVVNKALANAWYNLDVQDAADGKQRRLAHSAEANSMAFAPTFVDAANGDFRLATVQANAIDAGADRAFQQAVHFEERARRGNIPTVCDATGVLRPLGNGPDVGAFETVPLNYAVFNLDADYTCSAGVYKSDGTLIRTLFSGQRRAKGTNVIYWNGLTDNKQVAANDSYTIKMIAHNVQYVWEGVVGNSSNPSADSHVHGSFEPISGIAIVGTTAFYTAGYNENKYELYRFDTRNPNNVTKSFGPIHNIYSDAATDLATDGNKLYTVNSAQVAIYNVSDCNPTTFGNGQSKINAGNGQGWIEVQRNGNLLFVARKGQNMIYIFDKNSGNQTGSISVNQPSDLALTASGDLWVISGLNAVRYQVSSGGGNAVQTIGGFGNPVGIACSPVDGTVLVTDASTHQIKAFNSSGGAIWTHGQANGYASSPRVTADKFYFGYAASYTTPMTYFAPLVFQPDGTWWVGDTFMSRTMHFNTSRQLLDEIDFMPHTYNATADINNPSRVFNRFTEYAVDYSKPLGQGGWTITNFWGFNKPSYMYGFEDGVFTVVTLNNGRTYGTIYDGGAGATREVVELTSSGLRETSVKGLNVYTRIEKDGSMLQSVLSGSTVTFQKKPLTGFTSAGDPQWGGATALGSAPVDNGYMTSDPYSWRSPGMCTNNLVVSYDGERTRTGYHLGAVKQGSSQWLWKALPSAGGFDGYGNFESWCEYGGNMVMTSGRNIFAGAHSEFYGDVGQGNQFFHFYDNGLLVGQFGSPMVPGVCINAPGAAGNSFAPTLVDVGSESYLYHNDEWSRGSHRWHPVGMSGIKELTSALSQGQAPVGTTNTPSSGGGNTGTGTYTNSTGTGTSTNSTGTSTNTTSGSTNGVAGCDLVVTAFSMTPASPATGTSVKFNATIKNQGSVATPDGGTVGIGFYVDGTVQAWWFTSTTALAPGASWDITSNDGPNAGSWIATAGAHTIVANIDDAQRITESNETNNTMTLSFTVGATGSTNTTGTSTNSTGTSTNSTGTSTNTTTNTTVTLPTVSVAASVATASEAGTNGVFTVSRVGATTNALTVNYTVAGTASNGVDYVALSNSVTIPVGASNALVTVVPLADTNVESSETVVLTLSSASTYTVGTNSSATVTILDNAVVTSSLPDLVVLSVTASPTNPAPGQQVLFSATVKNQGTVATPSSSVVGVGFYVNGGSVSTWSTISQLQPGQTATLTANDGYSGASWTALQGTNTITAIVDDVNRMAESNETNNSMSVKLLVGVTNSTSTATSPKMTIRPAGSGKLALNWPTTTGSVYQVSYKTNLASTNWTALSTQMTATATSMSYTDTPPTSSSMRLYNVKKLN